MPFEAIIFDLDGTLLDTLEDIADATNAALSAFGLPTHPVDAYRYFVGDGVGHLVRRIVPEASRDDDALGESLREAFAANYAKCWSAKTQPYEGIPEMLDALSEKGIRKGGSFQQAGTVHAGLRGWVAYGLDVRPRPWVE